MNLIPGYARKLPVRQQLSIGFNNLYFRLHSRLDNLRARFFLWRFGAKMGSGLQVNGRLRCNSRGMIIIGRNVRINSGPARNYVGGDRRTNIWVAPGAFLEIEDGVGLSNTTIVARTSVRIRKDCLIGGGCNIYDNDFHELKAEDRISKSRNIGMAPIEIGPKAFVGAHTIILKGVIIGEGAVVGAGSLVSHAVPPYEVWAGRPARLLKKLPKPE